VEAVISVMNYQEERTTEQLSRYGENHPDVLIVEAQAGAARRERLQSYLTDTASTGARTFLVSCDFDVGGPWAGVGDLVLELLPDIEARRPDLMERHSLELVYVFPELRRRLHVRNPNLTDLAEGVERTRNYPVDRAYRNAHGLIDLLDNWKRQMCEGERWVIACDGFDLGGAMGSVFFRQLMRRRARVLNLRLLASVAPGNGAKTQSAFDAHLRTQVVSADLAADVPSPMDTEEAGRQGKALEERIGEDPLETKVHLCDLLRLWATAGRSDKIFEYKIFALHTYNTAGMYEDAIRYAEGLLGLAAKYAPDDEFMRWCIAYKLVMSHLGIGNTETAIRIAEEDCQEAAKNRPDLRIDLLYLLAMFASRFAKPRDFEKGEQYLQRGLEAIEEAGLPEGERHFRTVFNRNGLAMIRNFQGRHKEAIELCRKGVETLNQYLGADEHRLHRSVLFYNMAQVYAASGSYEAALQNFAAAMQMDPNYSEYYNDRGNLLLKSGRLVEAKADYLMAIELSPPYFEVFVNLGQCCRRMGDMGSAIENYSRAIDIEPRHVLALLGRAKAYEELGAAQQAIEDYTAALEFDSSIWEAFASRGVLHYEAGRLAESLSDFNAAIALNQDVPDLYQNRATVLGDLDRTGEAIDDLRTALRLGIGAEDELDVLKKLAKLSELVVPK
jgi:tetratricopeptide (TPR) repeat protein